MNRSDPLYSGWLGDIPLALAEQLVDIGQEISVPAGQIHYTNGATEADLYGIRRGTLRMQIAMNEQEQRVAHICGPGFWFGELELIAGHDRIMETEAAEDLVLFRIRSRDVLRLAQEKPDLWRWLALLSSQHLSVAIGAADDLMLPSAEKRMIAVLLRLSGHRMIHPKSPHHPTIHITQENLAATANLSRASAGRILRQLAQSGAIRIEYGSVFVRDPEILGAGLT